MALRRRLANQLLGTAARIAVIADQLEDLQNLCQQRPWTEEESRQVSELRAERRLLRMRHDQFDRQFRRLPLSSVRVP